MSDLTMAESYEARLVRERAENRATYAATLVKFKAIAKALGGSFKESRDAEGYNDTCDGTLTVDGLALWLRAGGYNNKGRVSASTVCMTTAKGDRLTARDLGVIPYGDSAPSATMALDKPADKLAREIGRRVIEPYKPIHAAMLVKLAQRNAYDSKISDLTGRYKDRINALSGCVFEYATDEGVNFKLRGAPPEKLDRILAILEEAP